MTSFRIYHTPIQELGSDIKLYFSSWFTVFVGILAIILKINDTWSTFIQVGILAFTISIGIFLAKWLASKGIGVGAGIMDTSCLNITCKINLLSFLFIFVTPVISYLAFKFIKDKNSDQFLLLAILIPTMLFVLGIKWLNVKVTKKITATE